LVFICPIARQTFLLYDPVMYFQMTTWTILSRRRFGLVVAPFTPAWISSDQFDTC
jgi:hypothetical protein